MATELPTPAEMLAIAQQALRTSIDPAGTGAVNLRPGSGNDTFISAALALSARNTAHIADRAAARSVRSAVGDDLVTIAADLYGTSPKPSNAATGTLYMQRSSSGATVIPEGSRFSVPAAASQASVTFVASQDVAVGSSATKVAVPIECSATGAQGNVPLEAITQIVDSLPDTGWSIYVPSPGDPVLNGGLVDVIAGGDDGEEGNNDALRTRLLKSSFNAALYPGTYFGIRSAVLAVPGIADATVVSPGDGSIRVFCGDSSYLLSAALKTQVQAAVDAARAFGNPALIQPYTVVDVSVTASIYMNRLARNYDTKTIAQQAVANVIAYFKSGRESPDSYFLSAIGSALETAHPEVQSILLTTPSADVKPLDPASYTGVTTINRYTTSSALVSVAVLDPQTQ